PRASPSNQPDLTRTRHGQGERRPPPGDPRVHRSAGDLALLHHQEPPQHDRPDGTAQVQSRSSEAHAPPRDQVNPSPPPRRAALSATHDDGQESIEEPAYQPRR